MGGSTEKLWRRARNYLDTHQTASARVVLEAIVERDAADAGAHLILAGLAWSEGRVREATRRALAAKQAVGDEPGMINSVVKALLQVGEMVAARELLARPVLAGDGVDVPQLLALAGACQALEQHAEALACYERARARGAEGIQFRFLRAVQLAFNGRVQESAAELDACITGAAPFGRVYIEAARLHRATPDHNYLSAIERQLALAAPGSEDQAALEFARYKECEDLERYEEAWQALTRANQAMAVRARHDPTHDGMLLRQLLELCTPEFLRGSSFRNCTGPQPIFIIGMPRSGTTLLDRLLGAHAEVRSTGELRDFGQQLRWLGDNTSLLLPDETMLSRLPGMDFDELGTRYLAQTRWRAQGRRFFTDKLTVNWMVAGLIAKALPDAKILHMLRDPMDVCFSNYRAFFSDGYPWSYDLASLAAHHRQYRDAMVHWHATLPGRILDVPYARLVDDPEAVMRRVLAHCGLDWDPDCLDAARNDAPVATLSFAQARQPVHRDSLAAWRPYAAHLEPLRAALADGHA